MERNLIGIPVHAERVVPAGRVKKEDVETSYGGY